MFLEKYWTNRFIFTWYWVYPACMDFHGSLRTQWKRVLSLIESKFIKILIMSILSYYIIFFISLLAGSFRCTGAGGRVCSFMWLSANRWASWLYGSWLLFAEFLPKPALLSWTAWSPRHHQPKPAVTISASCQSVLWPDQFPHRSRQHPCHTWGKPF